MGEIIQLTREIFFPLEQFVRITTFVVLTTSEKYFGKSHFMQ